MSHTVTLLYELIANLGLAFTLVFIYGLVRPTTRRMPPPIRVLLEGLLFGVVAAISILTPPPAISGIKWDVRAVIVGVAAVVGGSYTAGVAALIACIVRLLLGGEGVIAGIGGIVVAALLGYGAYLLIKLHPRDLSRRTIILLVLGVLIIVENLFLLFLLPGTAEQIVIDAGLLPFLALLPVVTYCLATLLLREHHQIELREALRLSDTAIKHCADGVVVTDTSEQIILGNYAAACMFGYADDCTEQEALNALDGMPVTQLLGQPDRSRYLEEVQRVSTLSPGTTDPATHLDMMGVRADGGEFPVRVAVAPMHDGRIQGFVTVIRDLTQLRESEGQVKQIRDEQERVTILQRFIGDASHDLKTPLASLSLSVEMLNLQVNSLVSATAVLADPAQSAEALRTTAAKTIPIMAIIRQRVGKMMDHVSYLQRMIDDLLEMARLDAGQPFKLAAADLNTLVDECLAPYQALAQQKQVDLRWLPAADLPLVRVDESEFNRVLRNLIENAITYTRPEGAVTISTGLHDATVILDIADTGIGISAVDLPLIFNRFYRADAARSMNTGGTGLGLPIVRKVVEAHEGTITVESEPNRGSRFRIALPPVTNAQPAPR